MIVFLISITLIVLIFIFGGSRKLKLKVKSINSGETFTVERKDKSRGNEFLDWFYYDEGGNLIEDENLKKSIFEAFSDEDWYADYEFYTNVKNQTKVEPENLL